LDTNGLLWPNEFVDKLFFFFFVMSGKMSTFAAVLRKRIEC